MRFPFRPIAIGLFIGAALFFMPFRFPFFFLFLLIFFFRPWGRRRYGWRHSSYGYPNDVLPIDGNGSYHNQNPNAPETKINIH